MYTYEYKIIGGLILIHAVSFKLKIIFWSKTLWNRLFKKETTNCYVTTFCRIDSKNEW